MNILITLPVEARHKAQLEQVMSGDTLHYVEMKSVTEEMIQTADIILGNVPVGLLHAPKNLKWMQLYTAGSDVYCHEGVLSQETVLTNATGSYGLPISEYMLGVLLELNYNLYRYRDNQNMKYWHDEGRVRAVQGATTLVIGLGDIGSSFAKRMKAMGSYVIGIRRTPGDKLDFVDELYTMEQLDEQLSRADFVSMSLPNTPQTIHMMNKERLLSMKKDAILINVGRGNAICTDDLYEVMMAGHLRGCAVDVTDPEPLPVEHNLWEVPNLIITPHISGNFHIPEILDHITELCCANYSALIQKQQMQNLVDFETGYRSVSSR